MSTKTIALTVAAVFVLLPGSARAQQKIEALSLFNDGPGEAIRVKLANEVKASELSKDRFRVEARPSVEPTDVSEVKIERLTIGGLPDQHKLVELFLSGHAVRPRFEYRVQYHLLPADSGGTDSWISSEWTVLRSDEQGKGMTLFGKNSSGPRLDVDVRSTEEGVDQIGVDYDLQLVRIDTLRGDSSLWALAVSATSRGYIKNQDSTQLSPTLDSVQHEVAVNYDRLFPGSDGSLASFMTVDFHVRNEATQDYESSTVAIGAGLSADLGFLFPLQADEEQPTWIQRLNILDTAELPRPISAPRFYLGYDNVQNADDTNRAARTGDTSSDFNRIRTQAVWSLPAFSSGRLSASWEGFWDLDADDEDFTTFTEVKLAYPLKREPGSSGTGTELILKYVDGGLPPDFTTESAVTAGFSLSI